MKKNAKGVIAILAITLLIMGCDESGKTYKIKDENGTVIFEGCNGYDGSRDVRLISLDTFSIDTNNQLIIRNKKWNCGSYLTSHAKLKENMIWSHTNSEAMELDTSIIVYDSNYLTVTDKEEIVFEDTLPTMEEISAQTGIDLPNAEIMYTPFRVGNNYSWDQKTHIVSVGIDMKEELYYRSYSKIFYFYIQKGKKSWDIGLIYDVESSSSKHLLSFDSAYQFSTDEKARFCLDDTTTNTKCLVREEDTIVIKKLFGEIYPEEFLTTIQKYDRENFNPPYSLLSDAKPVFDQDNNMHLFYNDLNDLTGKYFYYKMFSQDEPMISKYAQKVYWE